MARSGLGTSGRDAACSRLGTRLSDEARRLKVIHPCLTACERAAVAIVVMRAQRHGGGELGTAERERSGAQHDASHHGAAHRSRWLIAAPRPKISPAQHCAVAQELGARAGAGVQSII